MRFIDTTVAHGMTSVLPTNAVAEFNTTANGGLNIIAANDSSTVPLGLYGYVGHTSGSTAIQLVGAMKSGTTVTDLTGTYPILQVLNYATVEFQVLGNGGVLIPNMKSGATQVAAGAAAGELWHDTDDDTVKMGV